MSTTDDPAQAVIDISIKKGVTFVKSPSFRLTINYFSTAALLPDGAKNLSAPTLV